MSRSRIDVPSPAEHDYHADREVQRVEAAKKRLDPSDILSILDGRIAAESDPSQHPLFPLVEFYLDRRIAVDGGAFFDRCKQLVLAAIDSALDDALECLGED
jgi:hypothetical protein